MAYLNLWPVICQLFRKAVYNELLWQPQLFGTQPPLEWGWVWGLGFSSQNRHHQIWRHEPISQNRTCHPFWGCPSFLTHISTAFGYLPIGGWKQQMRNKRAARCPKVTIVWRLRVCWQRSHTCQVLPTLLATVLSNSFPSFQPHCLCPPLSSRWLKQSFNPHPWLVSLTAATRVSL